MKNSITFLGTGTSTGVPMIGCHCSVCSSDDPRDKRLRTSALVEYDGLKLLIDCGPDFRTQALTHSIENFDAILLTHQHKDHTGGLDDIRALNYICRKSFPIYCENRVLNGLKREYDYVFSPNPYPGIPQFDIHIIDENPFRIEGHTIVPIRAMHASLPILGFRFGALAYITDASSISDKEIEKLKGLNVLVVSAVRRTKHPSHLSLRQAVELAVTVGAKESFITHISHQMAEDERNIKGRHADLMKEMPYGVSIAYDGLKVEF